MTTYTRYNWVDPALVDDTRMNNIEQGVIDSFNWSEMAIDSDKDMSANTVSNVVLSDVSLNFIIATPGTTVRKTDATEYTTSSGSYVKLVEFTIPRGYSVFELNPANDSTFTIEFNLKSGGTTWVYARVYRNGAAIGTEQGENTTSYVTKSENISGWFAGDTIEIWAYKFSTDNVYINNFTVKSTNTLTPLPVGIHTDPTW